MTSITTRFVQKRTITLHNINFNENPKISDQDSEEAEVHFCMIQNKHNALVNELVEEFPELSMEDLEIILSHVDYHIDFPNAKRGLMELGKQQIKNNEISGNGVENNETDIQRIKPGSMIKGSVIDQKVIANLAAEKIRKEVLEDLVTKNLPTWAGEERDSQSSRTYFESICDTIYQACYDLCFGKKEKEDKQKVTETVPIKNQSDRDLIESLALGRDDQELLDELKSRSKGRPFIEYTSAKLDKINVENTLENLKEARKRDLPGSIKGSVLFSVDNINISSRIRDISPFNQNFVLFRDTCPLLGVDLSGVSLEDRQKLFYYARGKNEDFRAPSSENSVISRFYQDMIDKGEIDAYLKKCPEVYIQYLEDKQTGDLPSLKVIDKPRADDFRGSNEPFFGSYDPFFGSIKGGSEHA